MRFLYSLFFYLSNLYLFIFSCLFWRFAFVFSRFTWIELKTEQRHSIHGMMEEENVIRPHQEIQALSFEEKKFLLAVERGDVAGTRR